MLVSLQYLRGLAALMVVYHHLAFQLSREGGAGLPAAPLGAAGVDLFFVISGFIMWVTTVPARLSPGEFLFRRATRIVPLYWAVTALITVMTLVVPHWLNTTRFDAGHVLASFLFVPAVHPVMGEIVPIYIQGWTINYEAFFYVVMGLCLFAPPRAWFGLLVGTMCLLSLAGALGVQDASNAAAVFLTRPILLEFCLGLSSGWLFLNVSLPRTVSATLAVIGMALLVGTVFLGVGYGPNGADADRPLYWGAPSFLIVTGLTLWERRDGRAATGILSRLGDASYSIYMTHIIVLPVALKLWRAVGLPLQGAAGLAYVPFAFAAVCLVGRAGFLAFERPSLRILRAMRSRFATARRAPVVGSGEA